MRVTTVISRLSSGGAERRLVFLAQWLAGQGHSVTLLTRNQPRHEPGFYDVPRSVHLEWADEAAGMDCRWRDIPCQRRRLSAWRKAILETAPDVVISFSDITNIHTLMALKGARVPVVVSERTDPRFHHDINRREKFLRRLLYPKAAAVVLVAEEALPWARALRPHWPVEYIPNPVEPAPPVEEHPPPPWLEKPCIVGMGRLVPAKGFGTLLECFARLAGEFPQWRLCILGEGPLRETLETQARDLGLEGRVLLPGAVNPPWGVLHHADVFVLSSSYEGFPNALCEAMACGVACVSFACPSGPAQIIRHGEDGLLVPNGNAAALTEALRRLLTDQALRRRLGAVAPTLVQRYSVERVMGQWRELLLRVTQPKKGS